MQEDRKIEEVEIFGEKYRLVSEQDGGKLQGIADLVNEKMHQVSKIHPNYSKSKIAILVSLNLADELMQLTKEHEKIAEIDTRLEKINANLEKYI